MSQQPGMLANITEKSSQMANRGPENDKQHPSAMYHHQQDEVEGDFSYNPEPSFMQQAYLQQQRMAGAYTPQMPFEMDPAYLHQQMQALPPHLQAQIIQTAQAHLHTVMMQKRQEMSEAQRFAQWQQQRQQQQQYLHQHHAEQQRTESSACPLPTQEVEPSERRRPTGLTPMKEVVKENPEDQDQEQEHEELCNCPDCNEKRLKEAMMTAQPIREVQTTTRKFQQLDPNAFEFQPQYAQSGGDVAVAAAYAGMSPLNAPAMGFDQAMNEDVHPAVVVGTQQHQQRMREEGDPDALSKFRAMNSITAGSPASIPRRQGTDVMAAFGSKKTSPVMANDLTPFPSDDKENVERTPTKQHIEKDSRGSKKERTPQTESRRTMRNSNKKEPSSARKTPNRDIVASSKSPKLDAPAFHVDLHVVRGRKVKAVCQFDLQEGDHVIFEGDRGFDLGQAMNIVPIEAGKLEQVLSQSPNPPYRGTPMVLRHARAEEVERWQQMITEAREAVPEAQSAVDSLRLNFRIVDAVFQYDREKLTFFYDAQARVDFRVLLKELFGIFRCRIWMEPVEGSGAAHSPKN